MSGSRKMPARVGWHPSVDQDARRTTYTAEDEDQEVVIVLEGRRCQDTMSGESFEPQLQSYLAARSIGGAAEPCTRTAGDECLMERGGGGENSGRQIANLPHVAPPRSPGTSME